MRKKKIWCKKLQKLIYERIDYMKKSAIIIAAAAIMLASCKNQPDTIQVDGTPEPTAVLNESAEETKLTAGDITAAITAEIEIPSAIEKNAENIGAFYDVDVSSVTDMSVLICGSGAYPDELAVFCFADSGSASVGADAVRKRLESQIALYTDYTPDEVYKLDGAVIIEKDNWVILAVCSDNDRAKKIIESFI